MGVRRGEEGGWAGKAAVAVRRGEGGRKGGKRARGGWGTSRRSNASDNSSDALGIGLEPSVRPKDLEGATGPGHPQRECGDD